MSILARLRILNPDNTFDLLDEGDFALLRKELDEAQAATSSRKAVVRKQVVAQAPIRKLLNKKAAEIMASAYFEPSDYCYEVTKAKKLLKLFDSYGNARLMVDKRKGEGKNVIDGRRIKLWNCSIEYKDDLNSYLAQLGLKAVTVKRSYAWAPDSVELQIL